MNPEALTSPALPARHGFFTRRGGVSTGPFASLNCSLSSQDAPEAVAANRAAVARTLEADHLLGLTQIHGPDVVTVTEPWRPGAGPRADALVTATPGLALAVVTADCTPILLADPAARVIGAVHAGWRGALAGVLEATIAAMEALGAARARISAAIGPCIRQASYEVRADLRDAVLARDPAHARFFQDGRPDHWQFDLAGYCAARLAGLGGIDVLEADTAAEPDRFFSHRRRTLAGGGPIGHQISAIIL
ncbi:MAG TPA: peptidoglycan editing factor PgeF [Acetobacteraceae bacterium]|nr:peptidoglycan editing factor PgeF [Acetobacteraceae bacterium]